MKTFTPRDPPWLTRNCRTLYKKYHRKYNRYVKRGYQIGEKKGVDDLRDEYTQLVNKEKEMYLKKLGSEVSDPRSSCKKYWTCLKRLLNKTNASIIPPIIKDGLFITDIKEKCNLFNSYFKNQCTIIDTASVLPPFLKKTLLSFDKIKISEAQITRLIRKLQSKNLMVMMRSRPTF